MRVGEVVLTLALKIKQLKRVLIITYYWPPAGGVAVQRWVKMCRYLRSFGWEPVIYTAENGEMPVTDHSLEATLPEGLTVIRRPIWEPYQWYRRVLGLSKDEKINAAFLQEKKKPGKLQSIAVWIRGNFFIPDARKFWIQPSIQYLHKYLTGHPVDAIVSTGPPHSMHLIAAGLKEKTGIPWIADFRDPWTRIDYYTELHLSKWADKKHHALEKMVVQKADRVVTVSWDWAADFNQLNKGNTVVITNGYDTDDFPAQASELSAGFVIHHIGQINKARNPEALWKALSALCNEQPAFSRDLRIAFTGTNDHSVQDYLDTYRLSANAVQYGQVNHKEAIAHMCSATVLLLLVNDAQDIKGRIPAKLFEYLAAKRPILSIGDTEGDAAKILSETKCGITVQLQDADAIKAVIADLYDKWKNNNLQVDPQNIVQYSRRAVTQRYAELLDSIQRKPSSI